MLCTPLSTSIKTVVVKHSVMIMTSLDASIHGWLAAKISQASPPTRKAIMWMHHELSKKQHSTSEGSIALQQPQCTCVLTLAAGCSSLPCLHRSMLDQCFWMLLQLLLSHALTVTFSLIHNH